MDRRAEGVHLLNKVITVYYIQYLKVASATQKYASKELE